MTASFWSEYGIVFRVALGVIGTLAGLAWAGLGISALRYMENADEHDRVYGWTLWWFVSEQRYSEPGRRLCQFGWAAFAIGLASWLGVYALK
jgi:hypothetical protein